MTSEDHKLTPKAKPQGRPTWTAKIDIDAQWGAFADQLARRDRERSQLAAQNQLALAENFNREEAAAISASIEAEIAADMEGKP